ncbi:MAG: 23S rRNA (adenine(2503)-C(2))-methyltransferase RlmN [Clostridia bacterium]|nr:23S rRNA (adenine(2503)-C(2))-methyltransferase RlmN [Clostridia bacterium]
MIELDGMTPDEIIEYIKSFGQGAYRGKQVLDWVVGGTPVEGMTNLSKTMREELSQKAVTNPVRIRQSFKSAIDGTVKFLFELNDLNLIEGVLMSYKYGHTLCLSTQVGCNMGCAFCASTLNGCVRNLTPGEMAGQVLCAASALNGERVKNLVLMGSGEPLDNYDNVVKFLRVITDERGFNMSVRGISLSTCGLVDRMYDFAGEKLPVTLSVSLHAPNDEIRKKLMPIARRYSIDQVLDACRNYIEKTKRRVVMEYALVDGINDSIECADELAGRLRGMQCHVNIIPLNPVPERNLNAPTPARVRAFLERLEKRHISATRRREMGDDIQGACGQLRRSVIECPTTD